jgi:hypothetical protein
MWPAIARAERKRALTDEDAIPASVLYDQFEVLTAASFAQDIAVSASGIAWVIGTTCSGGDCEIKKLNNSTSAWETADSSGIRIDVTSSGVPWMIKSNGNIYKRSGATALTGKWTQVAGCAKDISIGADNSVWILGCESAYGGYSIKRWNASSKTWEVADGVAVRIAVGPDGIPAVVTPDGWIYVRSEASALTGTWSSQSTLGMGALPDANTDLTFDNFAYWYRIGVNDTPAVFSLNQDGDTQTRGPYELFPGACKAISVGKLPSGNQGVWLVGTDGAVRRPTK